MSGYRLRRVARNDLKKIAGFGSAVWGIAQSNTYLRQLTDTFTLIAKHPDIGTDYGSIRKNYLMFPKGSHLIFYQIKPNYIEVVRILHKSMDAQKQIGTEQ